MIAYTIKPAQWRLDEGLPDECMFACVDEDELHAAVEIADTRLRDAQLLRNIARQMSYQHKAEAMWKHGLLEMAMRLERM